MRCSGISPKTSARHRPTSGCTGHTDFGMTTLLFSVPISCFRSGARRAVVLRPLPTEGALVINIGETLEIVSGGHFKAKNGTGCTSRGRPAARGGEAFAVLFESSMGDLRMSGHRVNFDPARRLHRGAGRLQGVQACDEPRHPVGFHDRLSKVDIVGAHQRAVARDQIAQCTDPSDTGEEQDHGEHQTVVNGKLMQNESTLESRFFFRLVRMYLRCQARAELRRIENRRAIRTQVVEAFFCSSSITSETPMLGSANTYACIYLAFPDEEVEDGPSRRNKSGRAGLQPFQCLVCFKRFTRHVRWACESAADRYRKNLKRHSAVPGLMVMHLLSNASFARLHSRGET